ncbi:exonuclease SbcCD subunit D [Nocardioides campestrisoli]|uniref:exonuclease SbcCD subunit D n=1 Tax=Nocardioides campestrisoli TaxID=2736757 RepID=UPI001CD68C0D|nr:exonuclease SbcCD subunit D [Nocardioides campestrisoli]
MLHTSDWHLGRSFHREGMLEHQRVFLDHLLDVVETRDVDLVLVSGDVYDRALPSVDAVRLADDAFARLAASRARVVVTSGNHDSALRLGFGSRLIDAAGVHIRTDASTVGTPVELADEHGPVLVYGLPYLDPDALRVPWDLERRSHEAAVAEAMRRVRADLAQRPDGSRSVVLAHAFVAGCAPSDSERDISVGGVSMVSSSLFDGIDYTALGHLHGAQQLSATVRYSGSPLAYSFSEAGHVKGSWLIELGSAGVSDSEFVPAPVPRPLARLRGSLDELLGDPDLSVHEGSWVQATLTDAVRPLRAMDRLRERFPHTLVLAFAPEGAPLPGTPRLPTAGLGDHEIALAFVEELRGAPATADESVLLREACEASRDDPADALVSSGADA